MHGANICNPIIIDLLRELLQRQVKVSLILDHRDALVGCYMLHKLINEYPIYIQHTPSAKTCQYMLIDDTVAIVGFLAWPKRNTLICHQLLVVITEPATYH
jgi:hypothetical protein